MQFNRAFTRRTLTTNDALEGNAFASFLLGAPSGGAVDVNPKPHYEWFFLAPWIQDDWRLNDKMTVNLGFRWDFNGAVGESDNMLNYAFDPTIVNPVSARLPQGSPPVMGGLRFAGVDGAPDRPWKYDKNNYQFRSARPISSTTRPCCAPVTASPSSTRRVRRTTADSACLPRSSRRTTATARRPMRWATPGRTGSRILLAAGSPGTFLGRGPTTSNPDFVVPNVHQFSAGIQRELPWRISLEATYAGSRSYDIEGNFGGFNEPSAAFQAQCDVTLGGSRSLCDSAVPNPFLGVAGFENTNRFTSTTLSRFELARPFPAFTGFGYNQQNLWEDAVRLDAARRQQTVGPGCDNQHQLHLGAALDGRWREYHDRHRQRLCR